MAIYGKKYVYTFLAFCIAFLSLSQVRYSTSGSYLMSKAEGHNLTTTYVPSYPDTSIFSVHNYVPRNFTGHFGLPQPPYLLNYISTPLGFRLYTPPFSDDLISKQEIRYYKTEGPFASLTGIAGSKQAQMFRMLYSQTLRKKLNITMKFNRYNNVGFYKNQRSFINNFYTTQNYTTSNNRFGFYSYLLYNKIRYQENGGIKYDSLFEQNPLITKILLPIRLSNAKREFKEFYASFNPWIKLNKRPDSVAAVSHYIDYKINYTGNFYQYIDAGSAGDGYYTTFYLDTTKTEDTTHLRQYINSGNYTLKFNKLGLAASVGYSNEYNHLHQFGDSIFSNEILKANLTFKKLLINKDSAAFNRNRIFSSDFSFSQIYNGPNSGDRKIELVSELLLRLNEKGHLTKKSSRIFLQILSEQRQPDYIYNGWYSNHFQWRNYYKAQQLLQGKIGFSHIGSGLSASVLYQSYSNFVYFDSTALPRQTNAAISNIAANLNFEKVFFKHLGVCANLIYQSTSGADYLRLIPSAESGSLYYYGNLFKGNLQLMIGAQVEMYQSFKAYDYMPATNMFYLQNSATVGDYPFVDVFINGRIRPVQFFVKVTNILQGYAGTNYYFVPGYIQPDRAFHFGLTWLFFD